LVCGTDKVGREHMTPMHPEVVSVLVRAWQLAEVIGATSDSWVFPAPKDEEKPISRDTLNKWWQRFATTAKLPEGQHYGWYSCRRGFANRRHRAGVALKDLTSLGGWTSSTTLVEVYLQPDEDAQRKAMGLDQDLTQSAP
jgi:integrase